MHKLEYLYQIPESHAHLPLLGSMIRALGKEWSVEVDFSGPQKKYFEALQKLLVKPEQITFESSTQLPTELLILGNLSTTHINQRRSESVPLGQRHVMAANLEADTSYDLVSRFTIEELKPKGITAVTGNGKGKTTTALGLAVESLVEGKKVAIIQWFKERKTGRLTWAINEHFFPQTLINCDLIRFEPTGMGFFGSPTMDRVAKYKQHRAKAYEGLNLAKKLLATGEFGVIVLDEFVDTVPEISQNIEVPLIDVPDLQELLELCVRQTATKVVVTGRRVTPEWQSFIGSSIVVSEIKHPWSTRKAGAVSGLDF